MNNVCKRLQLKIMLFPPLDIYSNYTLFGLRAKEENVCSCPSCISDPVTVDIRWHGIIKHERFIISKETAINLRNTFYDSID